MHTSFPPVAVGREWDTFECAGVETSPSTRFRSATIIYNALAELPKKELAMHIHKLLAVTVKNYLDTT